MTALVASRRIDKNIVIFQSIYVRYRFVFIDLFTYIF